MLYSNACEYGIRALTRLADASPGRPVPLKEIAAAEEIPAPYLAKILHALRRADLVRSAKGPGGGYTLARPPATISLLDIKEAIDGTAELRRCASGLDRCSDETPCPLHDTWKPVRERIEEYLRTTALDELAAAVARKRTAVEYPIGSPAGRPRAW